jgi:heme/copper-type cytochrome/quinol oxidase subunit 2
MYSKVVVMPDKDFEKWYSTPDIIDSLKTQKKDSTVTGK